MMDSMWLVLPKTKELNDQERILMAEIAKREALTPFLPKG